MASISNETSFLVIDGVVFVGDFVERETILKTGTTAALHKDPQFEIGVAFFGDQIGHLGGGTVGEQDGLRHFDRCGFGNSAHGRLQKVGKIRPMLTQCLQSICYLLFAASFSVGFSLACGHRMHRSR